MPVFEDYLIDLQADNPQYRVNDAYLERLMWALAMLVVDFFITPQRREDGSNLTCAFQHAVGPSTAFLPATVGVATAQVQGWVAQPPDVKATLARCEAHQKLMCHGSSTLLDRPPCDVCRRYAGS